MKDRKLCEKIIMEERDNFYLTKEGLEELKKECETLKVLRSTKVKGEAPSILESEDLNPDYVTFQEDLNLLETRIAELEFVIEKAEIIKKPSSEHKNEIDLGATVSVMVNGQQSEFTIVGTFEANPMLGKISNESPVGRALVGHRIGDSVTISSPSKSVYVIKKINYS